MSATGPAPRPSIPGYTVIEHLGHGGSADVWLVESTDGVRSAAKVFRDGAGVDGRKEWRAMQRFAGPHIMPVHDYVRADDDRPVLLMPHLSGGSLWDIVVGRGGLTTGELVTAIAPIAGALARVHDQGSVHGDVSPRNILFDGDGRPVLTDLGATRVPAEPGAAEWGSAGFVAPEVLDAQAPTVAADVYALGACMWFALCGEAPPIAALRPHLDDIVDGLPPDFASLITSCLSLTPGARPHASQVAQRLLDGPDPVALPLDTGSLSAGETTASAGSDATAITRRLRDEAQRRQSERPRPQREPAASRARSKLVAATVLGLGLVATAALWPRGGEPAQAALKGAGERAFSGSKVSGQRGEDRTGLAKRAVQAAQAPGQSSEARAPLTRGQGPTQAEIQRMLDCRASAWNDGKPAKLAGCLAPDSSADRADRSRLAEAARLGADYSGLSFTVKSVKPRQGGGATAKAMVTLTRSAFSTEQNGRAAAHAEAQERVELTFERRAGSWHISAWSAL